MGIFGPRTVVFHDESLGRLPTSMRDLGESEPFSVFTYQVGREMDRLLPRHRGLLDLRYKGFFWENTHPALEETAQETVRARWKAQGIWPNKSSHNGLPMGLWKHQEPFEASLPPELDINNARSLEEKVDIAQRREMLRVQYERDSEASRPYRQFLTQLAERVRVLIEQRKLKEKPGEMQCWGEGLRERVYWDVRREWELESLWDDAWGMIPGLSWRCEHPEVNPQRSDEPDPPEPLDDPALPIQDGPIYWSLVQAPSKAWQKVMDERLLVDEADVRPGSVAVLSMRGRTWDKMRMLREAYVPRQEDTSS